jgi:hypothetical protein
MRDRVRRLAWGLAGRVVATVAIAVAAAGCDGGGVPVGTTSTGGREDPGSTREAPPPSGDKAGGDCLVCDVTYVCQGPGNPGTISLSTGNGTCIQTLIDLVCGGTLFGATSCSGGGGGAFACGAVTCVPIQGSTPTPGGSGFGSSSSGGSTSFGDAG